MIFPDCTTFTTALLECRGRSPLPSFPRRSRHFPWPRLVTLTLSNAKMSVLCMSLHCVRFAETSDTQARVDETEPPHTLCDNHQDLSSNMTRFVVLRRPNANGAPESEPTGDDKTMLVIATADRLHPSLLHGPHSISPTRQGRRKRRSRPCSHLIVWQRETHLSMRQIEIGNEHGHFRHSTQSPHSPPVEHWRQNKSQISRHLRTVVAQI